MLSQQKILRLNFLSGWLLALHSTTEF